MEIKGKIVAFMNIKSGESAKGEWKRGGFVIEQDNGQFVTKVAFTAFGEQKLNKYMILPAGTDVVVTFAPKSREYNGNWYTDLDLIDVTPVNANPQDQFAQAQQAFAPVFATAPSPAPAPIKAPQLNANEDLPF